MPWILKGCAALFGAIALAQLAGIAFAKDPLKGVQPPDLASLAAESGDVKTNAAAKPQPASPREAARRELIADTEIFAPKPRPQPMRILGQAGDSVLLSAPNGQQIWLTEGQEQGGVTLLKAAPNRALVLHNGKTNEITLHGGYGSKPLLNKK